jgi:hypothetical protein
MDQRPQIDIQHFARTSSRANRTLFGIQQGDRLHHVYIIGKTGTGKTTLLETLIGSDLRSARGIALLDPHGDLADAVKAAVPPTRTDQMIFVDLADPDCAIAYNPLIRISPAARPLVASGLMDVFYMMWSDAWGPRMEHILRNALLALLDQPHACLPDILQLLSDKDFRLTALRHIENPQVLRFWKDEFPKYSFRYQADAIAPIQTKVGALLADPRLYRFFTAKEGQIRLRAIMDGGQILIVNLAKGRLGSDSASLVGGVLTTMLGLAAFSRANLAETERRPFFIYIDEFQNFTTLAIADMLSEMRKFKVGLVMAHQYLNQLEPDVRHAVLGNVGTLISFRVGAEDASYLAKEFEPKFQRLDLLNLANHHIYLRLMIDGAPAQPFSAVTILPK